MVAQYGVLGATMGTMTSDRTTTLPCRRTPIDKVLCWDDGVLLGTHNGLGERLLCWDDGVGERLLRFHDGVGEAALLERRRGRKAALLLREVEELVEEDVVKVEEARNNVTRQRP